MQQGDDLVASFSTSLVHSWPLKETSWTHNTKLRQISHVRSQNPSPAKNGQSLPRAFRDSTSPHAQSCSPVTASCHFLLFFLLIKFMCFKTEIITRMETILLFMRKNIQFQAEWSSWHYLACLKQFPKKVLKSKVCLFSLRIANSACSYVCMHKCLFFIPLSVVFLA